MTVLNINDIEYNSLDNRKRRRRIGKRIRTKFYAIFFLLICFVALIYFYVKNDNTTDTIIKEDFRATDSLYKDKIKHYNKIGLDLDIEEALSDFMPLFTNGTKGPITVNRELDDGTKQNFYEIVSKKEMEDFEKFYYDYEAFDKLEEIIPREEEYLCQVNYPTEGVDGYYLTCPKHYTLVIDDSFYGRYANDTTHCPVDIHGKSEITNLYVKRKCGRNTKFRVNELCGGRVECNLKPAKPFFGNPCKNKNKYLHVKYHCQKDIELVKPKFAIVTFINKANVNSIYENAISEFYQYADIHGYKFIPNRVRYDKGRDIYYMKLHVLVEAVINGLKHKEYDWVFWVDGDCMIANPNIKLESFIPEDNKIHFIAARNRHGLNAGVMLLRVHEWTLDFLMRSISFAFFHKNKKLGFADQSALNDVLTGDEENEHYVIVTQSWFNTFPNKRNPGDFLLHFAGRYNKTGDMKKTIKELRNETDYTTAKTNRQMREEVLNYYNLPDSEKLHVKYH